LSKISTSISTHQKTWVKKKRRSKEKSQKDDRQTKQDGRKRTNPWINRPLFVVDIRGQTGRRTGAVRHYGKSA